MQGACVGVGCGSRESVEPSMYITWDFLKGDALQDRGKRQENMPPKVRE